MRSAALSVPLSSAPAVGVADDELQVAREEAARIRAIADAVVPEEVGHPFDDSETMHHIDARMHIRQRFLAEVLRARQGEG